MSGWQDAAKWAALQTPTRCPICRRGRPLEVIAELDASWVTMPEEAPLPGYACVVSRRHVVELHELSEAEGAAFMRDLQRVSGAVAKATRAMKLNYEIHGNSIPHLHAHIFPRYMGDPFEGKPIEPRASERPVYAPGEFITLRALIQASLRAHSD